MAGQIVYLMFLHWLADFVCQTDQMALNKSKSQFWLNVHAAAYSGVLFLGLLPIFGFHSIVLFISVNWWLHYGTDFVTSRVTSYLWQKEERHWFFVMIGFDQLIHFCCLYLTFLKWVV